MQRRGRRGIPGVKIGRAVAVLLSVCLVLSAAVSCVPPVPSPQDPVATPVYSEQHRPQIHFSPPANWMNDPNGLVYYDGEYHLFYQYYPGDTVWGPMHWGHAVSTDLLHWQNLPVALFPDELGYIFSGSAVVDQENSSGFGIGGKPPLVAIFTYHNPGLAEKGDRNHEYQGIAWSNDHGRSWTKYDGNPVLPNTGKQQDFRDPKVFWHKETGKWVMALSVGDHVQFWASDNLREWRYLSSFGRQWGAHGGVWECPDLVEMHIDGGPETRWVLIQNLNPGGPQGGSGTQYFVGEFDGTRFTLDESFRQTLADGRAVWLDSGRDNYAGVTWSGVPDSDGRTLFIGWMGNWDYAQQVPTSTWRSAMTLPRELSLKSTPAGFRVYSTPARELAALRREYLVLDPGVIGAGSLISLAAGLPVSPSETLLEFELPDANDYTIEIALDNALGEIYRFGYVNADKSFYSDRREAGDASFSDKFPGVHRAARITDKDRLRLHLVIDAASIEIFADEGATVMTDTFFPTRDFSNMKIRVSGAAVRLTEGTVYRLGSVWN